MVFGKDRAVVVRKELTSDATVGRIDSVDAAQQSVYTRSMCANIRPIFFPAPSPARRRWPYGYSVTRRKKVFSIFLRSCMYQSRSGWFHHLCRTSLTSNQITLGTAFVGLSVTLLYATGYLDRSVARAGSRVLDGVGHLEEIAGPCDVDLNVPGNSDYLGCLGYGRTWTAGSFC
jgi:hypothetical protein